MKNIILIGLVAICLMFTACSVEDTEIPYGDDAIGIDLTNCKIYFDGCNECSVVDGKLGACTEVGCEGDYSKDAKCIEYIPGTGDWATSIAESSNCTEYGTLSDDSIIYNENSKTYWINLDPFENPYNCNPACVVYEDGSTEVNWRCTGLLT